VRISLPKIAQISSVRGFTLIEVLVATAVIAIVGSAILSTVSAFLRVSLIAQHTVRAQNLANEKMEVLKNMPYDDLATQHGPILPQGNIPDSEIVTSGGHDYIVRTYISFVDDTFDGNALGSIPGKPIDFYPFDYKKATIAVSDKNNERVLAKLSTNISADAAETSDDTGILFLKVINSVGSPVANANVHLTNPNPSPPVDITTITDTEGNLQIPLLPEDTSNGYHLEVSLPGYSTDQTYPDNIPNYNPVNPDFNILAQQVTNVTLAIDLVSTMQISVVSEDGAPVTSLDVTVAGEKLIYVDPDPLDPGPPIPRFNQTYTSDSSGNITIEDLGWDGYSSSVPGGYYIISIAPYQPVNVPADSTVNVTLKVTTDASWPRIEVVTPISGINSGIVSVEVIGANLPVGSTMKLAKSGESTITATGVISSDGDTRLNGNFDLDGVATGTWNLVVTGSGGKSTTQTGGFTISSP